MTRAAARTPETSSEKTMSRRMENFPIIHGKVNPPMAMPRLLIGILNAARIKLPVICDVSTITAKSDTKSPIEVTKVILERSLFTFLPSIANQLLDQNLMD